MAIFNNHPMSADRLWLPAPLDSANCYQTGKLAGDVASGAFWRQISQSLGARPVSPSWFTLQRSPAPASYVTDKPPPAGLKFS
jgi:hypothetical protein